MSVRNHAPFSSSQLLILFLSFYSFFFSFFFFFLFFFQIFTYFLWLFFSLTTSSSSFSCSTFFFSYRSRFRAHRAQTIFINELLCANSDDTYFILFCIYLSKSCRFLSLLLALVPLLQYILNLNLMVCFAFIFFFLLLSFSTRVHLSRDHFHVV